MAQLTHMHIWEKGEHAAKQVQQQSRVQASDDAACQPLHLQSGGCRARPPRSPLRLCLFTLLLHRLLRICSRLFCWRPASWVRSSCTVRPASCGWRLWQGNAELATNSIDTSRRQLLHLLMSTSTLCKSSVWHTCLCSSQSRNVVAEGCAAVLQQLCQGPVLDKLASLVGCLCNFGRILRDDTC